MLKKSFIVVFVLIVILVVGAWATCPGHGERLSIVTGESVIDMPRSRAWNKLRDLTLARHYVPGIIRAEITTEQTTGVGTSRRVYQSREQYLNETVIEWNEGHGFTLKLHKDDGSAAVPFAQAWFDYRLSDEGEHKTRLYTALRYEMIGGCLGYWVNRLLFIRLVQQRAGDVPRNLKRFYEEGGSAQSDTQ